MAISPESFPPEKRRQSPKLISGGNLLQSIADLAGEIASLKPLRFPLRKTSLSTIRKAELLSVIFTGIPAKIASTLPSSAGLCLEEIHIALQRAKGLIESFSAASGLLVLMKSEIVCDEFREVSSELSTLLDIFPAKEIELGDDVAEIFNLAGKRRRSTESVDSGGDEVRREAAEVMDGMERGVVPDRRRLSEIFERIGVSDSASCRDEVERLGGGENSSGAAAMLGLVRYSRCVLFPAGVAPAGVAPAAVVAELRRRDSEVSTPADFRCPISLEVMKDPVVVATGQTYDKDSIRKWIESGHRTCPKSGQNLANTELIPNNALRSLISAWSREQRIGVEVVVEERATIRAAIGATRMTAEFLVEKLAAATGKEEDGGEERENLSGAVYEIRAMAKSDTESRACVAEAGAVPLLVRHLASTDRAVQVNAVTAILNLSILESNKDLIMETEGAVSGVAEVLRCGIATWEARGNAAAAVFSLASSSSDSDGGHRRRRLGRRARVVKGLLEVVRDGPAGAKRDALAAVLCLAGDREGCFRLVEAGAVETVAMVVDGEVGVAEEAAAVIEAVVKRGGLLAVAAAFGAVKRLGTLMRVGSEQARESAAATLVAVCRKGGAEIVGELVAVEGIERVVWEIMGNGTARGRRKAATLMRILRRWAAAGGLDNNDGHHHHYYGNATTAATSVVSTMVLPSA